MEDIFICVVQEDRAGSGENLIEKHIFVLHADQHLAVPFQNDECAVKAVVHKPAALHREQEIVQRVFCLFRIRMDRAGNEECKQIRGAFEIESVTADAGIQRRVNAVQLIIPQI